jgi:hypothetical protein
MLNHRKLISLTSVLRPGTKLSSLFGKTVVDGPITLFAIGDHELLRCQLPPPFPELVRIGAFRN